jgi:hypothetical protein
MLITINAKNGIEARRIAEERFKDYWFVTSKKLGTYLYQVELERRKMLRETLYVSELNTLFLSMKALVEDIIKEPVEVKKITKEIENLYKGIASFINKVKP